MKKLPAFLFLTALLWGCMGGEDIPTELHCKLNGFTFKKGATSLSFTITRTGNFIQEISYVDLASASQNGQANAIGGTWTYSYMNGKVSEVIFTNHPFNIDVARYSYNYLSPDTLEIYCYGTLSGGPLNTLIEWNTFVLNSEGQPISQKRKIINPDTVLYYSFAYQEGNITNATEDGFAATYSPTDNPGFGIAEHLICWPTSVTGMAGTLEIYPFLKFSKKFPDSYSLYNGSASFLLNYSSNNPNGESPFLGTADFTNQMRYQFSYTDCY